jgi:peptidylprolyl isomerase
VLLEEARMGGGTPGIRRAVFPAAIAVLISFTVTGMGCGARKDKSSPDGSGKTVVEDGDRVRVEYTGTLDNGAVFDRSDPETPLEFVVGSGEIIRGFDRAVVGMTIGEEKTVEILPKDAYGEIDSEKVAVLARSDLPAEYEPEKGMKIRLEDRLGRPVPGTIFMVGEDSVRVDLNHPLAGKTLTFEIKVVGIAELRKE